MVKTATNLTKFRLVLWKNFVLQSNHKLQLICEIFIPIILALILAFARVNMKVEEMPGRQFYEVPIKDLSMFQNNTEKMATSFTLAYAPRNEFLERIIKGALKKLGLANQDPVSFKSAKNMEHVSHKQIIAAVEFIQSYQRLTFYPKKLAFKLRFPSELRSNESCSWETNRLYPKFQKPGPRNPDFNDDGVPTGYFREGFLQIQHAIALSHLELKQGGEKEVFPEIVMRRFPYAKYTEDEYLGKIASFMPNILVVSFLPFCIHATRYVAKEKEKQLKEYMKMLGISNWIHWLAWFVRSLIVIGVIIILQLLIFKTSFKDGIAIFYYSHWSVIFLFLFVYAIAIITYCFMIAVFFKKAIMAMAAAGLLFCIIFMFVTAIETEYHEMSTFLKSVLCLHLNIGMHFAVKIICRWEATGEGAQWDNLFQAINEDDDMSLGLVVLIILFASGVYMLICLYAEKVLPRELATGEGAQWDNLFQAINEDDDMSLGLVVLMILFASGVYMLICLYAEKVLPGELGVSKRWNFCIKRDKWSIKKRYHYERLSQGIIERFNLESFEQEPQNKRVGIAIRGLKKRFDGKLVVKGVSLNMYEDEIMVLLGHIGAGQTTIISMLAGITEPTAGTAKLNDRDIRTNLEDARASLGICQHLNVLFGDMSVANHLKFYSKLRGFTGEILKDEIDKYLEILKMTQEPKTLTRNLSDEMQRKLTLCIALCGETKVVLCDEATSRIDPAAKQQFWNLLQTEKIGRTVLFTTHLMDEADVLGDRIAIMCDGELKCHGSPFFLRKKFGTGYRLICSKTEECNIENVTILLEKYIPDIKPESDMFTEVTYRLPFQFSGIFGNIFAELEDKLKSLSLSGFSVCITSLEEVFMKVGAEIASPEWTSLSRGSVTPQQRSDDDLGFSDSSQEPRTRGGADKNSNDNKKADDVKKQNYDEKQDDGEKSDNVKSPNEDRNPSKEDEKLDDAKKPNEDKKADNDDEKSDNYEKPNDVKKQNKDLISENDEEKLDDDEKPNKNKENELVPELSESSYHTTNLLLSPQSTRSELATGKETPAKDIKTELPAQKEIEIVSEINAKNTIDDNQEDRERREKREKAARDEVERRKKVKEKEIEARKKFEADKRNREAAERREKKRQHFEMLEYESQRMLRVKGRNLTSNHWRAMFYKKAKYTLRNKYLFILQNLIAIIFMIIAASGTGLDNLNDLPPMTFRLQQYFQSLAFIERHANLEHESFPEIIGYRYRELAGAEGDNYYIDMAMNTDGKYFESLIFNLSKEDQTSVNRKHFTAVTIEKNKITVWFNNQPLHVAPLALNLIHTSMARALFGDEASIMLTNHPLPYSSKAHLEELENTDMGNIFMVSFVSWAMAFITALFAIPVIKERTTRFKLMQYIAGLQVSTYWLSHFLWDLLSFAFTIILMLICLSVFKLKGFSGLRELVHFFVLTFVFGIGVLPFTYVLSYLFSDPVSGYSRIAVFNFITGMGFYFFFSVLKIKLDISPTISHSFFVLFPHFSFEDGWAELDKNIKTHMICQNDPMELHARCKKIPVCCELKSYYTWESPGILREILGFLIIGSISLVFLTLKDNGFFSAKFGSKSKGTYKPNDYIEDDVQNERNRVRNLTAKERYDYHLVLDNLAKYYRKFLAVKYLSLCVKSKECFGLLGVNGAGKTAAFRMITGDVSISSGNVYIRGLNFVENKTEAYKKIGYCPQSDAFLEDITGRETMFIIGLLRGIPLNKIKRISEELTKALGFMKYIDRRSVTYNSGTKRKLSIAIAIIGAPSVVFLDEPTTGLDPFARRQLWDIICQLRDHGKLVMITTQSIDECEAVCTRLAVMVNGELKCIGTPQHLKNKFSKGLVLKVQTQLFTNIRRSQQGLSSTNMNRIKEAILNKYPSAILQSENQSSLGFYIPLTAIKWSEIFTWIEANRAELYITDYAISSSSLEELFLDFTRTQFSDTRNKRKKFCC